MRTPHSPRWYWLYLIAATIALAVVSAMLLHANLRYGGA